VQAASTQCAAFKTEFPQGGFGNAIKTACQIVANESGVAVVRVTLSGFDTHSGQPGTQARLLGELAGGVVALRSALEELGKWNDTLVLTYAEFGRRPKEKSAAPITAPRTYISRWAVAWPAESTARPGPRLVRRRKSGLRARFRVYTRRSWTSGGLAMRVRLGGASRRCRS
jgi:hypothetical protein